MIRGNIKARAEINGNIKSTGGVSGGLTAGTGGGGSTVSITPVLEVGEKIADFVIDDVPGELFAPSPIRYSVIKKKLYTNSNITNPANITLDESINDFDFILFDVYRTSYNQYHMPAFIYSKEQLVDIINNNQSIFFTGWVSNNEFVCYKFTNDRVLYKSEEGGYMLILNIYGIRLGAVV